MHNRFKTTFNSMEEVLNKMFGNEMYSGYLPMEMYVLSNETRQDEAVYMFDTKVMDEIAERLGTDIIIILPSSIHETILLKKEECMDYGPLLER